MTREEKDKLHVERIIMSYLYLNEEQRRAVIKHELEADAHLRHTTYSKILFETMWTFMNLKIDKTLPEEKRKALKIVYRSMTKLYLADETKKLERVEKQIEDYKRTSKSTE